MYSYCYVQSNVLQLRYENKYNALVEKCLLEADEEICMDNSIPDSTSFTINKMVNPDLEIDLEELENEKSPNTQNNNFRTIAKILERSEVDTTKQTSGELGNKNNGKYTVKETSQVQQDKIHYGKCGILCSQCQTFHETQAIFENHKIFCDKKENTFKQDKKNKHVAISIELEIGNPHTDAIDKLKNKQLIDKREISESVQSIYCPVCSEMFKTQQDFDKHKHLYENLTENVSTEIRKRCGHCKELYSNKKDLLNHIVQCHKGQLLFRCFTCDKTYEKWSSLDIHEATHRLDKPYLCDLCGKSFKHSNYLRGHKRTHLDESRKKRHACEICEKAFRSR